MRKQKQRKSQNSTQGRPVLNATGFLRNMGLPVPQLPFLIGSATNLPKRESTYPNLSLSIPIAPQFAGVAAGGLTTIVPIDGTIIYNFASRFANVFKEACVVGAKFELRMNNVVNPAGMVVAYIDEQSSAAPTTSTALDAPHLEALISQTESPSRHTIEWVPESPLDLSWEPSGAIPTPAWLKLWTNVTNGGTTATTTATVQITGAIRIASRGYM
jgi:hypothetical protein